MTFRLIFSIIKFPQLLDRFSSMLLDLSDHLVYSPLILPDRNYPSRQVLLALPARRLEKIVPDFVLSKERVQILPMQVEFVEVEPE